MTARSFPEVSFGSPRKAEPSLCDIPVKQECTQLPIAIQPPFLALKKFDLKKSEVH